MQCSVGWNFNFSSVYIFTDNDEIWSRISAKRKEILGQSSLRLRSLLPRYMYKVRFELPGFPVPERADSGMGSENETSQETTAGAKEIVKSSDQLLQNRVNSLQGLLKRRRTRSRAGVRRGTKIHSGLVNSVDYTIRRSKMGLQRAREARCGKLSTMTTPGIKDDALDDHKQVQPKSEVIVRCGECQKLLKERDKFWGLESDSEEEGIKEFNEHVRRRNLRRDSRIFETAQGKVVGMSSGASRHKVTRGIAGRGTWTTRAYVPAWAKNGMDKNRANSFQTDPAVLQEGRHKQGIDIFLNMLRRNPPGLRVVIGQNYVPKLHLIASFCVTASNNLSKEIFSNNTKHRKPISKFR